jgi:hypothetical protein
VDERLTPEVKQRSITQTEANEGCLMSSRVEVRAPSLLSEVAGGPGGGGTPAFAELVLLGSVTLLAVVAVWLAAATALTVLAQTARWADRVAGRLARAVTPPLLRTLVAGACGATLAAPAATAPASAGPPEAAPPPAAGPPLLPLPDRPVGTGRADLRAGGVRPVLVRPGDTLWDIAATHLPRGAADARVARAWPRWFRINRVRIGPDPHLIRPSTQLRVPPRFR